jgi:acyl-CoA reductase-like NAD-dependent aldehyde dehydrogenase
MGRPIRYCQSEIDGLISRAESMIQISTTILLDNNFEIQTHFKKKIKHEPLGIILIIPAWNYPYLISINTLIPALLSGNAVVFKNSSQTPTVGNIYESCLKKAGLHEDLFLNIYTDHYMAGQIIADSRINYVACTGSFIGGRLIVDQANNYRLTGINNQPSLGFKPVTLELGGKDPAYVCEDADLEMCAAEIGGGSFFNSGQCCCAVERVYVHKNVYNKFVELVKKYAESLVLGNPLDTKTTLGPMTKHGSADIIRIKVQNAINQGARQIVDHSAFHLSTMESNYLAPQILINVNHNMEIMTEETFGPVMPVMKVENDEEAIRLMNDSKYGLTASVWTRDLERGERICNQIETGTVFVNRCDYLDPELAWTGVKETGMGCSLSYLAYYHLTRPKSYYMRT